MKRIFFLSFLVLLTACQKKQQDLKEDQDQVKASVEKAQDWDIFVFGEDNDRPHNAIYLKDTKEFIILGQKFNGDGEHQTHVALVRLDQYGKVLKKRLWGDSEENYTRIIQHEGKILISGYKNDQLAILQIDSALNTVMDTTFQEYTPETLYLPQLIPYPDGYVAVFRVEKVVHVVFFDKSFKKIKDTRITNTFYPGLISFRDAVVTATGKLVITGGLQSDEPKQYNYDIFFAQVDLKTGALDWIQKYGTLQDYYTSTAIVEWKGKFYATGMGRNNDDGPDDKFDVYLWRLSDRGTIERVERYPMPGSSEWGNDINVVNDELLISGSTWESGQACLALLVDENGKLIKTKTFAKRAQSELNAVLSIDDQNLLLLRTAGDSFTAPNSWELTKTTVSKMME